MLSAGLSPSQIIAVWLPRLDKWRSIQFVETFKSPSSNHFIDTFGYSKLTFLILEKGLIQSIRLPCLCQNASGLSTDSWYIELYSALPISAFDWKSELGGKVLSDILSPDFQQKNSFLFCVTDR